MSTQLVETRTLTVSLVDDQRLLPQLADAWDELALGVPFRTFAWCDAWWRHYRTARSRLMVLVVRDEEDQIVGIAPWYVEHSAHGGRVVRFLGSGEVCSDYLTVLCAEACQEPVVDQLAGWLASEGAGHWELLDLSGVEAADRSVERLSHALAQRGHVVERRPDSNCWRIEFTGDWNAYLATISRSRRDRARTMLRRLVDTGKVQVRVVHTQAELDRAFEILIDLHQKRRNSLSQQGCFASDRFGAFHRDIATRFLASGQLRIQWIEQEGVPMAIEYSLVNDQVVYFYQGGFEPALAALNPGRINTAASLRQAIEQGYQSFDFLRGDEPYKASWGAVPRPLVRVRIAGRRPTARVRFATRRGAEAVRRSARQWINRAREYWTQASEQQPLDVR